MGVIKYNDRTYSGLIQANGCFIDTDNVIASGTYTGSFSYTATQDCYFYGSIANSQNNSASITIDGVPVYEIFDSTVSQSGVALPLKKGQVIALSTTFSQAATSYKIYGIQQGSPITFLSEYASACYDTNEREVGCWVDGKPLYQKTVHIGNLTFDTNWHNVAHGIANIDKVISCEGIMFGVDGEFFPLPNYRSNTNQGIVWGVQGTSSEYVAYINNWYNSTNDAYATLKYTKTTDTAGSGQFAPTGMPTHHYSTNEQIVGTYLGKPLYQKTYSGLSVACATQGTWYSTGQNYDNIEKIVDSVVIDQYGQNIKATVGYMNSSPRPIALNCPLDNRTITEFTIWYTKTTD